jgi:hypothetical protein
MMEVRVVPDSGEPYVLKIGSRDVVAWEKIDRRNTMTRLDSDPKMADIYSVSHLAAKRRGLFTGTLAEWETAVDLELDFTKPEELDPTQPGQ